MKKFFIMMVMAIAISFSFTSCWTTGGSDDWGKVGKLTDNGSELRWTANEVFAEITYVYGYKGQQITSHKEEYKYGSSLLANAAYGDYEEDEDYAEVSKKGKVITVVYPESEYQDLTVDRVKEMYESMKEINDEVWDN